MSELLAPTKGRRTPTEPHCPVCGRAGRPFRSAQEVAHDLAETVDHHADGELKLMRDEGVPLAGCDRCGTLWRADPEIWRAAVDDYRADRYEPGLLARLHQDELEKARDDQRWLVANGAAEGQRLLEVGCYVGGFLAFAGEHGASATGLDPNPQMVGWCHSQRLDARLGVLDASAWRGPSFDGVWILNCFDQVARPAALLNGTRRLVKAGGPLVIRTPSAAFVRAAYAGPARLRAAARQQALWGVPHLCCYTVSAAADLVRRAGFSVTGVRARPTAEPVTHGGPAWFDLTAIAA